MKTKNEPDIFAYIDYRKYLGDNFAFQKKKNSRYSYRVFSRESGFKSPSVLKEVINGRFNLSEKSIPKFMQALNLTKTQEKYFNCLVLFNQAKTENEKSNYFIRLINIRKLVRFKSLTESQYAFCDNWYNSAVREIITLKDFKPDEDWICNKLNWKVSRSKIRKSLNLLLDLGLIKKDNEDKFIQDIAHLKIEPEVNRLATRNLNRSMVQRGYEAIELIVPDKREISGTTFGLSRKTYKRLQSMLRKFKSDIKEVVDQDPSDSELVCQLNYQLFPLTNY